MKLAIGCVVALACRSEPSPVATPHVTVAPVDSIVDAIASGHTEVLALDTGLAYKFKGLAIDAKRGIAYLGSWNKQVIVAVELASRSHRVIPTKYDGTLNGMGVYLRGDTLYAVMNEVNDAPRARALSVLVVIDTVTRKVVRSYELRATGARHHFNHVVVDASGRAYITDTLHATIHTVDTQRADAAIEPLVTRSELELVHGIDISEDGARLAITSYRGGIQFFDLREHRFATYADRTTAGDDGLKYYQGALYGIGQNTIRRHVLTAGGDGIARSDVLLRDHERFNDPRCLHIEDGWLYALANIEHDPVTFGDGRTGRRQTDTHVLKVRL